MASYEHRHGVPFSRTVAGVGLRRLDDGNWAGEVDGIRWIFCARERGRERAEGHQDGRARLGWGGFTAGHQTGCAPQRTLRRAIAWVRAHREEIADKVATRPAR
jgi:hypothetical protein